MSELNLHCHYQTVRSVTSYGEEFTLHEAFSTDKGDLYMICPIPVYIAGETISDLVEIAAHSKKDIEKYGVKELSAIMQYFEKYAEYTVSDPVTETAVAPDYSHDNLDDFEEETLIEEDDYHDADDKVLDLVEYMKKNKRR